MPFKDMPLVIYFLQPGTTFHNFSYLYSNFEKAEDVSEW
jgi:hypothetical protein